MSKKIEKPTPEQEQYLPVFRQKYLDLACDGKRMDRNKMQDAINRAYAEIDKEPPLLVILQSPLQAMMAIKFMQTIAAGDMGESPYKEISSTLDNQLSGQLWDQLRVQLSDQLWVQLSDQLGDQLSGQLRDQLRVQLEDQLWVQLSDQLWGQLGGQLRGQLSGQLRDQLSGQLWDQQIYNPDYLWGSQDLYWLAWAKFGEHIGVKYTEDQTRRMNLMIDIGSQCEWWWSYDGICFASEKPTTVKWDGLVLHCEDGPAVEYADGYAVYSWRGTNIPAEWIKDKTTLTPDMAITWENVEQRRCIAEILGWHNILADPRLKARTIDKDDDPEIGELIEVDIPDVGTERFLKVVCGTGRDFALPCPPDMPTALDAQAWLNFCTTEDILSLEFRT